MRSAIVAVLSILAFAPRASHAQSHAVPVVVTSDYYAQPKVLVLHALNNSGKDITGYAIIIRHKKPDGTLDENGRSESMEDMLGVLIMSEMAKDHGASERREAHPSTTSEDGVFLLSVFQFLTSIF